MLDCAEQCTCGTKKAACTNNREGNPTTNTNAGKNAFERHEIAVQEAKKQIAVRIYFTLRYNYNYIIHTQLYNSYTIINYKFNDKSFISSVVHKMN